MKENNEQRTSGGMERSRINRKKRRVVAVKQSHTEKGQGETTRGQHGGKRAEESRGERGLQGGEAKGRMIWQREKIKGKGVAGREMYVE